MSNDLISRSTVIEMLNRDIICTENAMILHQYNNKKLSAQLNTLKTYRAFIEEMTTSYDVDKVVEQLEEKIPSESDITCSLIAVGKKKGLKTAIEIVKEGGKDE